jgi:uncharacterized iron-regulated membrane protein
MGWGASKRKNANPLDEKIGILLFVWNKFLLVVLCFGLLGLFGVFLRRENRNSALGAAALVEINHSVSECIERVVLALGYILTGEVLVATLANDDVASLDGLTAPNLYA